MKFYLNFWSELKSNLILIFQKLIFKINFYKFVIFLQLSLTFNKYFQCDFWRASSNQIDGVSFGHSHPEAAFRFWRWIMPIIFCFEESFGLVEFIWFWLAFHLNEFVVKIDILVSWISMDQRVLLFLAEGHIVVLSICRHRFLFDHFILLLLYLLYHITIHRLSLILLSWLISIRSNSAGHISGWILGISSDLDFYNVSRLLLLLRLVLLGVSRGPTLATASLLHLLLDISLFGLFSCLEFPLHLLLLLQSQGLFLLGDLTVFILNSALWAGSKAFRCITDILVPSRPEGGMVVQSDPLPFHLTVGPSLLYVLPVVFFLFISITKSIIQSFIIFKKSVPIIKIRPAESLKLLKGGSVLLLGLEVGLLLGKLWSSWSRDGR